MYRHLFRNRWIALAFVLMMAASAATLVGTEDSDGVIDQATARFQGQKAEFKAQAEAIAKPTPSITIIEPDEITGETDDEDILIDPGTGVDPTPPEPTGFDPQPDLDPNPAPAE
jgi:hypothetical protein